MQNLKRCVQLNVYIKKLPASCRQQRCICLYAHTFSPHANSSCQTSGQKVKKCIHYIYTKYLFFIFKKCIHYIYTRKHISSRQQSFQRPHHYSPIPQICRQQAEIGQITTNHYCSSTPHAYPHFAGSRIKYTTQQSQATARLQQHSKKVHTHPAAGIYIFFRPLFPLPLKRQIWSIHPTGEEKKEKKGYEKVLKGIKRYEKGAKSGKRYKKR